VEVKTKPYRCFVCLNLKTGEVVGILGTDSVCNFFDTYQTLENVDVSFLMKYNGKKETANGNEYHDFVFALATMPTAN
jgi:hypothetical protein